MLRLHENRPAFHRYGLNALDCLSSNAYKIRKNNNFHFPNAHFFTTITRSTQTGQVDNQIQYEKKLILIIYFPRATAKL